jgi:hypothetical protein
MQSFLALVASLRAPDAQSNIVYMNNSGDDTNPTDLSDAPEPILANSKRYKRANFSEIP